MMKNILMKLLSALLVFCTVFGTFTAFAFALPVASFADEQDGEDAGSEDAGSDSSSIATFDSATFLKTSYATPEAKLRTMSIAKETGLYDEYLDPIYSYEPYKTYKNMELYVQPQSGEVAIRNKTTGQVIFTNPYDAGPNQVDENGETDKSRRTNAAGKLPDVFSQLVISYENIKTGKSGGSAPTMNSFNDAAAKNQITVNHIKNGVSVEYVIGTVSERRLVPMYIEKYRFETLILSQIKNRGTDASVAAYNKMLSYYATIILSNGEDGTPVTDSVRASYERQYPALALYGPGRDNGMFVSEGYDPEKESEYEEQRAADLLEKKAFDSRKKGENDPPYYVVSFGIPYTGYMSMYVYGKPSEREKLEIEGFIKEYCKDPEYTFADLEDDHALTGYQETAATLPAFSAALEYTLKEDGFQVRMPANSLSFDEDNFRLLSVSVLPYLGAGSYDNTGYVFVPDGTGSLIRFEDYVGTPVVFTTGTMYGPDNAYHTLPSEYTGHEEKMRAPVYGIVESVKLDYELNEDGTFEKTCPHVWAKKSVKANCSRQTDGGTVIYCKDCGETKYVEVIPYAHTPSSNPKVIQAADCHHVGISEGTCQVCTDLYNQLIKTFTEEQIEERYGNLKNYYVETGYGDHKYSGPFYVEIDGQCYEYYRCTQTYELTDENGNVVYERDENGALILKNREPVPVTVECGQIQIDPSKPGDTGLTPVEHEFDESTEVTYVKDGHCYIEHTCMNCGYHEVLVDEHRFGEEGYPVYADGQCSLKKVCSVCSTEVLIPTEHTYTDEAVYDESNGLCRETKTCALCGHKEVTLMAHKEGTTSELIAEGGRCYVNVTCARCGTVYTSDIDHEYDADGVCIHCNSAIPEEEGHTYEPAFVDGGSVCYSTYICTDCGKEYGDGSARVAASHEYGEVETEGAACAEKVTTFFSCFKCGHRAEEAVCDNENRAEHQFEWVAPEGVVCTKGYDETQICSVCGEVSGTRHIVGHTYGKATVLTAGLEESVCEVCGHVHYMQTGSEPAEDRTPEEESGEETEADSAKNTFGATVRRGFFAVMTEGSTLTSLMASTGGVETKYCRAYMIVNPRPRDTYNLRDAISTGADAEWTVVSKRKYTGNYTFEVTMLQTVEGDQADKTGLSSTPYEASYSGMAAVYRDYLRSKGVLKDLAKESGVPLYLEAFGAISVASTFLTIPTTEMKALNTFDGLKTIIGELNDEGIETSVMNVRLKGFTNGGSNPTMPYKVSFEKVVGGDDGYSEFLDYSREKGIGVYPDFDFVYMHKDKLFDGYSDSDHAVETIDGRYIVKKEYDSTLQIFTGTGLLAVSSSVFGYFCDAFEKNYGKFNNLGISVATLGTDLNSDFDKDDPYNREDSRSFTVSLLERLKNSFGSVMIDGGNDYAIGFADHVLDLSMTGSTYQITSCSVPFLTMVLHGSVNYAGGATNMASSVDQEILHIIENGAAPRFIIASENTKYLKESSSMSKYYSLDYSTWKEDIVDIYKEVNDVLADVVNAKFIGHEFIKGVRIPDKDEVAEDRQTMIRTIKDLIAAYRSAETRKNNADALFERKFSGLLDEYESELFAIISSYDWSKDEVELEDESISLTDADKERVNELLTLIGDVNASKNGDLYPALLADKQKADSAFKTAQEAFEREMRRYEIYFDVKEEDRMNPDAYNADSYKGVLYNEGDKIVLATDGAFDLEGNQIPSAYDLSDNSIVRVTYDNGVEIYINYNYYDVIVKDEGQNVRIPAYGYYKTEKGAD